MLGVPGLVEERMPVVRAAHRLDDQHDPAGNLDRRAERARALVRPASHVEFDVRLRGEVDPEVGERAGERRQHRRSREAGVPLGSAQEAEEVGARRLVERKPEPVAEELVERARRRAPRSSPGGPRHDSPSAARAEVEALVQLAVARGAERGDALADRVERPAVDRVQPLLDHLGARGLEPQPPLAVGLVRDLGAQQAVADRLAVDLDVERGLELGERLGVLARQVPEVALAREAPQLRRARRRIRSSPRARGRRRASSGRRSARRAPRAPSVVLQPGEVEVVLLVDAREEPIGLVAVPIDGAAFPGGRAHRSRRIARHVEGLRVAHRAQDAGGRDHEPGARDPRRSRRRGGGRRVGPAHDRGDHRAGARRPGGRPRLRALDAEDRRRTTGTGSTSRRATRTRPRTCAPR